MAIPQDEALKELFSKDFDPSQVVDSPDEEESPSQQQQEQEESPSPPPAPTDGDDTNESLKDLFKKPEEISPETLVTPPPSEEEPGEMFGPPEPPEGEVFGPPPPPDEEDSQGWWEVFWESTKESFLGTSAAFIEGVTARNLFSKDDEAPIHPWVRDGYKLLGEVGRMIGEAYTANAVVGRLLALPWVSRGLQAGGSYVARLTSSSPRLARVMDKGRPTLSTVLREGVEGLTFSGMEQLALPEERKPGIEGTIMNIGQFAGGGLGMKAANSVIGRVGPNLNPIAKRLIGFSGDAVGGALAAYGITGDVDEIANNMFAAEVVAIGTVDLLTTAMLRGRMNPTAESIIFLDEAQQALGEFRQRPSPDNEKAVYEKINEAVEAATPEGAQTDPKFADQLVEQTVNDWSQDVVREAPLAEGEISGRQITQAFSYPESKTPEIDEQIVLLNKYADEIDMSLDHLLALAKIESDFTNVGNDSSSARGPLQVTDAALYDLVLKKVNPNIELDLTTNEGKVELQRLLQDELGIDITTLEGRIRSSAEYLEVLRDHYELLGDDLIVGYYSGPGYVRKWGITNAPQPNGQPSNREYVRRFKEALESLHETARELPPRETPQPELTPPVRIDAESPERPTPEARPVRTGAPSPESPQPQPRPLPQEAPQRPPEASTPEQAVTQAEPIPPSPTPLTRIDQNRTRAVWRGNNGQVQVRFQSDIDTLLYDYAKRLENRQTPTARFQLEAAEGRIRAAFDLGPEVDVGEIALQYRKSLRKKAEGLAQGETLVVPRIKTTPASPRRPRPTEVPPHEEAAAAREEELALRDSEESPVRTPEASPERTPVRPEPRTPEPSSARPRPEEAPTRTPEETPVRTPEESPTRTPEETVPREGEEPSPPREGEATPSRPIRLSAEIDLTSSITPESGQPQADPSAETPTRTSPIETPAAPRETQDARRSFDDNLKDLDERLKDLSTEITPEELERLRSVYRPSAGFSINTTRYDMSGGALHALKTFADATKDTSVQTLAEVESLAKAKLTEAESITEQLGLVKSEAETLARVLATAPETVTALRGIVATNAADLRARALEIVNTPENELGDLQLAKYMQLEELHRNLTGTLTDIFQGAGRTVSAGRVIVGRDMVDLSELNIDDLQSSVDAQRKVRAAVEAGGGKRKIVARAKVILESRDLASMTRTAQAQKPDKPWARALAELKTSSILTNPATALVNVAGQSFNALSMRTLDVGTAIVGSLRRGERMTFGEAKKRITGDVTGMYSGIFNPIVRFRDSQGNYHASKVPSVFNVLSMVVRDPLHAASNLENAIRSSSMSYRADAEGMRQPAASSTILKESPFGRAISRVPLNRIAWWAFDQAAAAQRVASFGMLEMTDRPFMHGGYFSELAGRIESMRGAGNDVDGLWDQVIARRKEKILASQIEEQALSSGLEGSELAAARNEIRREVTQGKLEGVSEERLKLIDEIDQGAMRSAEAATFKDEIQTPFLRGLEGLLNRFPLTRMLIPIYHTPVRLFEEAVQFGIPVGKTYADLKGDNGRVAQDRAIARTALGVMLYTAGWQLASNLMITPAARDDEERQVMREAGVPEHSIKIGGIWVDYNRFDPKVSMFLNATATAFRTMSELEDEKSTLEVASGLLVSIIRNTVDMPWLTGISDFINAIEGHGSEYFLPSVIEPVIRPFQGTRRFSQTWELGGLNPFYKDHMEDFRTRLEDYDQEFPALDTFGKPRPQYQHILGVSVGEPTESPIIRELFRLDMPLSGPRDFVDGVKLSPKLYWEMRRYLDTELNAEESLNRLVEERSYRNASREEKKDMIQTLWLRLTSAARDRIKAHPEYRTSFLENFDLTQEERQERQYTVPDFFNQ